MDVNPNRQVGAEKTGVRAGGLDSVHAALRAADEIAAALQAHLTLEHGAHLEDRSHAVAPTLDLLRHARERIAAGLKDAGQPGPGSAG
jgi:hypothetical protein